MEVLPDLYVKDHMAVDLLKSWEYVMLLALEHFKGWPDVLHLFPDGLPPQVVAILSVETTSLFNGLWDPNPEFMSPKPILRLDFGYDPVPLLEYMGNPPCKCWFHRNTRCYCILSNLDGIRLLHILQCHPIGSAVFPLHENLPACCVSFRCLTPFFVIMNASCCITGFCPKTQFAC